MPTCSGNACNDITCTPFSDSSSGIVLSGYEFFNHGHRKINISRTSAGSVANASVDAGQKVRIVGGCDNPYHANYA